MAVRAGLGLRSLGCRFASRPQLPARVGGHLSGARWISMVSTSVQDSGARPLPHIARMGMPVEEKDAGGRSITNLARMGMPPGWKAGQSPSHTAAVASLAKPQIRDPERPKRPQSSWLYFLAKFRADNKDSQLKAKEVLIQAGTRWKTMTTAEKQPFENAAAVDMSKYKEARKKYVDSGKLDAWKRDPAKPKQPLTPFLKFANDFRQKHPELKVTEGTKQAKKAWEAVPSAEKDAHAKQYAKEREKYTAEMEAYKKSGKQEAWEDKVGISKAKKRLALRKEKVKEAAAKLKAKAKAAKDKAKAAAAMAKAKAKAAQAKAKAAIAKARVATKAMAKAKATQAKAKVTIVKARVATKAKAKAKAEAAAEK